jgi:hypothetical protein
MSDDELARTLLSVSGSAGYCSLPAASHWMDELLWRRFVLASQYLRGRQARTSFSQNPPVVNGPINPSSERR